MPRQRSDEMITRARAAQQRTSSKREAQKRGTRGRAEHKGKARSTNKPYGGKMAR